MIKIINAVKYALICIVSISLAFLIYSFWTVPDEIYTVPDEEININNMYSLHFVNEEIVVDNVKDFDKEGKYKVNVSLFNTIPVKSLDMTISKRNYVVVSGDIFGIRLFTDGVIVVGTNNVESVQGTVNPAALAGITAGDIIISIDGEKIYSCRQVSEIFARDGKTHFEIVYRRGEAEYKTDYCLYYSVTEKKYIAGLWIKDSAAGIGTMTYYDKNTGVFAGLGHGICDSDTNMILPLYNGDIVDAAITGCYKGRSGNAGELCGTFTGGSCGSLCVNGSTGVYGFFDDINSSYAKETPVAMQSEVKEGQAYIISTVDSDGAKQYSVEIEKIDKKDSNYRNMIIKITDEELIEKTGGIVQGMSGSPIIQNGMLVGAVTHVFINDPTRGYAIFAEYMLKTSDNVSYSAIELAS